MYTRWHQFKILKSCCNSHTAYFFTFSLNLMRFRNSSRLFLEEFSIQILFIKKHNHIQRQMQIHESVSVKNLVTLSFLSFFFSLRKDTAYHFFNSANPAAMSHYQTRDRKIISLFFSTSSSFFSDCGRSGSE